MTECSIFDIRFSITDARGAAVLYSSVVAFGDEIHGGSAPRKSPDRKSKIENRKSALSPT
jgi:hypothetical protein